MPCAQPTVPAVGGLYRAPRTPTVVDVPAITYLMVDGAGAPANDLGWAESVDRLRTAWRAAVGPATPPPIEVVWRDAERTRWTMMLALPGGSRPAPPAGCTLRTLHEGWCVQVMYDGEPHREFALARLDRFLHRQGYRPRGVPGQVHEIFLDDALPPGTTTGTGIGPEGRVIARRRVEPDD